MKLTIAAILLALAISTPAKAGNTAAVQYLCEELDAMLELVTVMERDDTGGYDTMLMTRLLHQQQRCAPLPYVMSLEARNIRGPFTDPDGDLFYVIAVKLSKGGPEFFSLGWPGFNYSMPRARVV